MSLFASFMPNAHGAGEIKPLTGPTASVERQALVEGLKKHFPDMLEQKKNEQLLASLNEPSDLKSPTAFLVKPVESTNTNEDVLSWLASVTEANRIEKTKKRARVQGVVINTKQTPVSFSEVISQLSEKHGMDPKLVRAVVQHESSFNPKAVSRSGAMGLMQLMPKTAKWLGVQNPFDPVQNLDGGIRYLSSLLKKYNGNVMLALAAYNAGPTRVDKAKGIPQIKETQNYVQKIMKTYLHTV